MKEKTFEELIEEKFNPKNYSGFKPSTMANKGIKELMKQVREATWEEFRQALLGVTLSAETLKKIGRVVAATDRITITDND